MSTSWGNLQNFLDSPAGRFFIALLSITLPLVPFLVVFLRLRRTRGLGLLPGAAILLLGLLSGIVGLLLFPDPSANGALLGQVFLLVCVSVFMVGTVILTTVNPKPKPPL
jgi:uncharacterized membrane protein